MLFLEHPFSHTRCKCIGNSDDFVVDLDFCYFFHTVSFDYRVVVLDLYALIMLSSAVDLESILMGHQTVENLKFLTEGLGFSFLRLKCLLNKLLLIVVHFSL